MIKGFATPEGTRSYGQRYSALNYNELNSTGLLASQVGFGCYRLDLTVVEHGKSLRKSLLSGVNLIDTSSNYGDGGSEELIGTVLTNLVSSEDISRESVVVVSKVGYLQGQKSSRSRSQRC